MTTTPAIYATERATVYRGRAEDLLPQFATGSVDLIVTDPPYGVGFASKWGSAIGRPDFGPMAGDDGSLDWPEVAAELARVLRKHRHAYVFGGLALDGRCWPSTVALVWDKALLGMGDLRLPWSTSHEAITFAVRRGDARPGDGALAARLRKGTVLRVPRSAGRSVVRHPVEKPVALLRQLIESSSCLGELVLDPFLGCGSTAVAALLSGRRFVGVELDPGYAAQAAERCAIAEKIVDQQEGI